MEQTLSLVFSKKLNDVCGLGNGNLVYSLLCYIDKGVAALHFNSLDRIPVAIDSSIEVFTGKKTNSSKRDHTYKRAKEEKDEMIKELGKYAELISIRDIKICDKKAEAALALISSIYLKSFIYPVQFFIPQSSLFSGHWTFWDKANYLKLTEKMHDKRTIFLLREKMQDSNIWRLRFKKEDFPEIVRRRLEPQSPDIAVLHLFS
jgi:hypothetical protein